MDDVITLIQEAVTGTDEYGNEIIEKVERTLLCRVSGVNRSEFYQAAQVGLKPELTVRLSCASDYFGEKLARFHGEDYTVIRTTSALDEARSGLALDEIELIMSKKVGDITDGDSQYLADEEGKLLLTGDGELLMEG